jgi:hypothetical protein
MKRISILSLLACCIALFACEKVTLTLESDEIKNEAAKKIAMAEKSTDDHVVVPEKADEQACNPAANDDPCVLVPVSGCFGCMNNEAHKAVNKAAAMKIMEERSEECQKAMQSFKGPDQSKKADPSCEYNSAQCSKDGICVPNKISQKELEMRMRKMMPDAD